MREWVPRVIAIAVASLLLAVIGTTAAAWPVVLLYVWLAVCLVFGFWRSERHYLRQVFFAKHRGRQPQRCAQAPLWRIVPRPPYDWDQPYDRERP